MARINVATKMPCALFRAFNPTHVSMYKVFEGVRRELGRPDLRHSGATMAAQAGATMRELMERLGHSTLQAALIYQHAAADREAALAARLSEMAWSTHKEST